jgi:DNA-binding transcriptional regulator GbsR (MarR family)
MADAARFVERFAASLIDAGWPRMPARVFVTLLASETGRLTAAELAERLEVSAAAISGAVRVLGTLDVVRREHDRASRRNVYVVDDDVWIATIQARDRLLGRWAAELDEGIAAVGPGTPAAERLAESRDFFRFLEREMPVLLERWREERATR